MRRIRISVLLVAFAAARAEDHPQELIERAVQMQQAADYAGAATAYREALKLRPDDVATHVNLGVALVHLRFFDEAISEYQAANKLLPGDGRIALNIALAYQKSGRLAEARNRFADLHDATPMDQQVTMLLADCELALGHNDRVTALLQGLAAKDPNDLGVAYMLGTALLREGRIEEGQVLLDRILRNGDSAEGRFLLGTRMFEAGDYPAAVTQLAGAATLNPHLPQLQAFYARALLYTGDAEGARAAFREELKANPNDFQANLGLGQILIARRQASEALPLIERALTMNPASPEAQLARAECLIATGHFSKARPYAEASTRAMPESVEAHDTLSAVYAELGLSQESRREHARAEALRAVGDPGPRVNEAAPDFTLGEVSLHELYAKKPVVLVFGSYSCPNFRDAAEALKSLYQRYGSRAAFLLVYIREAHVNNNWQSGRNSAEPVAEAATLTQKQEHAAMCSRKLHLPFPALVDGMDGAVESWYRAWPSRVFVVSTAGRVMYSSRLTELDFRPREMEQILRRTIE